MPTHTSTLCESAMRGLWRGAAAAAARAIDTLLRWQELASQRRALLTLNARMLADIGISRADAAREAARPFWEDPLRDQGVAARRRAVGMVETMRRRCEC